MKRYIALFLAFMLCLSLLPIDSLADEDLPDEEILLNEDIPAADELLSDEQVSGSEDAEKDILSDEVEVREDVDLPAADLPDTDKVSEMSPEEELLVEDEPVSTVLTSDAVKDTGTCGDDLTWTLYESGLLVITGTGEMYNYLFRSYTSSAPWYSARESITSLVIENGVTSIGNYAFYRCSSVASVAIPDSITSMGIQAFAGCINLTNIVIPGNVTNISNYAFNDCRGLTSIVISNGLMNIGNWAFGGCSSLTSITLPSSLTSIGDWAFCGCSSMTSITLPVGVISIGNKSFCDCPSLTDITIPGSVTRIGDYAFQSCDSMANVYYTGSESNWATISIGDGNDALVNATKHYNEGIDISITIPSDAVQFNGHYYYYYAKKYATTWRDAQAFCEARGGYLATLTSAEENAFVYSYIRSLGYMDAYFGFSDDEVEGEWKWITGETVDYTNWHRGEPNNERAKEDYATFYSKFADDTWNDGQFEYDDGGFICEWGEIYSLPLPQDFNDQIYRSNILLTDEHDQILSQMEATMPCSMIIDILEEEKGFSGTAAAWKVITTALDSATDPTKLYDFSIEEKDIYSAIILEMLEVSSQKNVVEQFKSSTKTVTTLVSDVNQYLNTAYEFSILDEMDGLSVNFSQLSDSAKELVVEGIHESFKEEFPSLAESAQFVSMLNDVYTCTGSIEAFIEDALTYVQLSQLCDSMKSALNQMYESCPTSNNALKQALAECRTIINASADEFLEKLVLHELWLTGEFVGKEGVKIFWKEFVTKKIASAFPELLILTATYKATKFITNTLCNTDSIVEQYYKMCAIQIIRDLVLTTVSQTSASFLSQRTENNAATFLSAVDLMMTIDQMNCDFAIAFCDASDEATLNVIADWLHFKNQNFTSTKNSLRELRSLYELRQWSIATNWIFYLERDYPESGLYEKYQHLLSETYEKMFDMKIEFFCPVNVYIYDDSNNLVAYAVNGEACAKGNIAVIINGDEKYIYIYDNADYRIVSEAYDSGNMDVAVTECNASGIITRAANFNDVTLVPGGTYEVFNTGAYAIDSSSHGKISADYDSILETQTYTASINGGYISDEESMEFSTDMCAGQVFEITAYVANDETFDGWTSSVGTNIFENAHSITTKVFMPNGNLRINAVISGREILSVSLGDVDGDSEITGYDASLILQYEVGLIDENELNISVADVDGDGKITGFDASLILQYEVDLISKFPSEPVAT